MQKTIKDLTINNEPFEALAKYTEEKERICLQLRQKEKNLLRAFRTHKKKLEETLKTLNRIPLEMQEASTRFWLRKKLEQTNCALEVMEKEMAVTL